MWGTEGGQVPENQEGEERGALCMEGRQQTVYRDPLARGSWLAQTWRSCQGRFLQKQLLRLLECL